MVQLYQAFPDIQIVATLSRQLSRSHFVELLPIQDETKRSFYAVMCQNENWSVRTLRERKNSLLFERTAISKKPEETIKNELLDGKDYYIDLLFYHRSLKRLVLVELKLGSFEPEHKGQVELYLRWLENMRSKAAKKVRLH